MTERRLLFGSVAEQYDNHRPSYPQQLVEEVLAYVGKPAAEIDVLEVGAGTGIATRQFAPWVRHLTAVEPDAEMAAVAAANPAAPSNVTQVAGDFESAQLEPGSFDLLISGTAWHWVEPTRRNQLAADALRPGGVLAPFWAGPEWSRSQLRPQLDEAYDRVLGWEREKQQGVMFPRKPEAAGGGVQQNFADEWEQLLADEPRLTTPDVCFYHWTQDYSAEQYVALLGTHSDHLMLEPDARERLLAAVTDVINGPGAGVLEMPYRAILCLGRRR